MKNEKQSQIKKLALLVLIISFVITGCSKNDNPTGPNQNGKVSFNISQRPGVNGGTEFLFNPTISTKITKVVCKYPAEQFEDVITNPNPNYTFSKDSNYVIGEYVNVTAGQQWKIQFTGTGYDITSDYSVK